MRELRQFGVHVANGILPVFIFVGLLLACGCVTEEDEPEWSLGVGDCLPDFSVETIGGKVVSAEGLRGRVAVVVLFNTSCPDCLGFRRYMKRLWQRSQKGLDSCAYHARRGGGQLLITGLLTG